MAERVAGFELSRTNTGYPYGDSARPTEFTTADIARIGKLTAYGDARTLFLVRLRDGRELSVNASRQTKEAERFLRKYARPVRAGWPDRTVGWILNWGDEIAAPEVATLVLEFEGRSE